MTSSRYRIGINLLPVVPEMGGISSHVQGLLTGIQQLDIGHDIVLFVNKELADNADEWELPFEIVETDIQARSRPRRYLYEQAGLPLQIRRSDIDVLHCPGYTVPLVSDIPTVVTIHDVNYEAIPETFSRFSRFVWKQIVPRSARKANAVITVSNFSSNEIIRYTGIAKSKISVVSNAPSPTLPISPPSLDAIDIDIEPPFVLYVGSTHPHKNHKSLIRAIPQFPEEISAVLVGPERSAQPTVMSLIESFGLHDRVEMPGFVSDPALTALYDNAQLYVHPSRYEGFGMPVLEAMRYKAPVVCADAASLPEIAGDAALYFNPTSPDDIASTCKELLASPTLRKTLIDKGKAREAEYSWEQSAKQTLAVCRSVVS